jgi:hypothetical protein
VSAPLRLSPDDRQVRLRILDAQSGQPTAARFSLKMDGEEYTPPGLGAHGLRFSSIHLGKKQVFVACYARGTGAVELPIPPDARRCTVTVAKGFEYHPARLSFETPAKVTDMTIPLKRWSDLRERGWRAAEEHLHYERLNAAHDVDWLTLLSGEDLTHAHFLVLKGGNVPGVWAQQYSYGREGEAHDGVRVIRPGEEYRDSLQGHMNLLGIRELIPPISTGGMGRPTSIYHYPAFYDVLQRARDLDGIGGHAHGTALGRSPTGVVDVVLGGCDFMEIANTHLYKINVWYQLMNCGYILPPAAGTDLPNFPFREDWQPLLGETRMYVRVGDDSSFDAWKRAVRAGEVFITSGPLIEFQVDGKGPGSTVSLPSGGGVIEVVAELSTPRRPKSLQIVQNGRGLEAEVARDDARGIHRWTIRKRIRIDDSCWLAARGEGVSKAALERRTGIQQNTIAHTAAIRVLVGDQTIVSPQDSKRLVDSLKAQREFYCEHGRYERDEHRDRVLELFDLAIDKLNP